jgi:tryptophan 2-monooxygenase
MQSSKTFVMVDRPFWKDKDPKTGRDVMSTTLTDRLTRGTYLFDNGDDKPAVICLTYSWMSDALKMLPHTVEHRVRLRTSALKQIYPDVDIASHIVGDPITVSWEADEHSLGAFKGALPGHYRYNLRMYSHFMQDDLPAISVAFSLRETTSRGPRVGRGRGTNRVERGLGDPAAFRWSHPSGQSGSWRRLR